MGMALVCRLQLGMYEAGSYFCVTVKFCRTLKAAPGLQLGQRIPVQVAVAGLPLNSNGQNGFGCQGHLYHQTKECPHCPADMPTALCEPSSAWVWRGGREVQLMPRNIWPNLAFLQVAWLRHGCSWGCTSVWDSPLKTSWAQLFLSAISRLQAQAARLSDRNVDRKQVSPRAGHTWTVLNPTHYTVM